jgi:hypothetical protein
VCRNKSGLQELKEPEELKPSSSVSSSNAPNNENVDSPKELKMMTSGCDRDLGKSPPNKILSLNAGSIRNVDVFCSV